MLNRLLIFIGLLISVSCQQRLLVETRFIGPQTRASYWVHTPDPYLCCPDCGQDIILSWHLPMRCFERGPIELVYRVRYGDRTHEEKRFRVLKPYGSVVHSLVNCRFWEKEGVLSYKAELVQCGEVIACWKHHLWVELIEFAPVEDDFSVFER